MEMTQVRLIRFANRIPSLFIGRRATAYLHFGYVAESILQKIQHQRLISGSSAGDDKLLNSALPISQSRVDEIPCGIKV